ncbi:MAG: hypothetical protein AB7G76_00210 [Steroidobacteraceae bacterium]
MTSKGTVSRAVFWLISVLGYPVGAQAYDAAAATIAANSGICDDARPFYWEIGGPGGGPIVSGQVGDSPPDRDTVVHLASASKWVLGTYVVQRYNGIPRGVSGAKIVQALNMRAGYTNLDDSLCVNGSAESESYTVADCFFDGDDDGSNSDHDEALEETFFYDSGHAQYAAATATLLNLGDRTTATLLAEVNSQLNLGPTFAYAATNVSGGMQASAADYAVFLQKIMDGTYVIHDRLDFHPVDTACAEWWNCPGSPAGSVDFHYSLHHWIEDNTTGTLPNGKALAAGDGAFSSAGAFGFYPWISNDLLYYGIISREGESGVGGDSLVCGRAIRGAFLELW